MRLQRCLRRATHSGAEIGEHADCKCLGNGKRRRRIKGARPRQGEGQRWPIGGQQNGLAVLSSGAYIGTLLLFSPEVSTRLNISAQALATATTATVPNRASVCLPSFSIGWCMAIRKVMTMIEP